MAIQVTGKNIDAGEAYKAYVTERIAQVFDKFIGPELSGHARLEKERGRFHTLFSVRLRTGLLVEVRGEGDDAYASADSAAVRLEKRVRRYKRRLKDHHDTASRRAIAPEMQASDYVVQVDDEGQDQIQETTPAPLVIAETEIQLHEWPVSEAVLQLDLTDRAFLLFRNAANGAINLVYRREDGNIGWLDPKLDGTG